MSFILLCLVFIAVSIGVIVSIAMAIGAAKTPKFSIAFGQWIFVAWSVSATVLFILKGIEIMGGK